MNEEEAIKRLNRYKTIKVLYGNTFAMHLEQLEQLKNDIETVLNLLEKKDKETEYWKNGFERELESNRKNIIEIINKDKIIDLMAEWIEKHTKYYDEDGCYCEVEKDICNKNIECDNCIKQYFERKVENGN